MEGVPRIPMMSFPMRRSADTPQFKSRLKNFISSNYNEDPDSYANEIHELESLRASAVHVSKDYSGCSTLKKYFCQLNFLKSRFPMNEGGSCAISFSWYDAFSETVHGWSDVDFEMSCVLYNIGALHSELGALDNRQTAEGMKTSCTHFQCAAWAFSHLRHNYQKFFTPDVSPDMLNILMNICLAQAQECILEKSLIDNRKSTITAKVALQIVEYYSTSLRIIDGMLKDSAQYSEKLIKAVKKWRKLVELKVQYYGCIAYLYRGMQAEDQSKWGERVAMYKAAAEKLNECIKLAKNLEKTDPVHDTLHFTLDVVVGKVTNSEKENEFIYHEKVPELEAVMSDVKAVSLVKGIQFKFDDPQVAGSDIFGRLVPMEAHEASSLYSEEKAKILRTYSRKIEEKNEALDKFVIPLQLEQLELHDSDKIPQELIDCCAALSVNKDTVKRLSELMAKLSSLFHDVEANLEEIQDHLAEQGKKEKEYQEVIGKRPPNNIINEIVRELEKYQSAQSVAADSNKSLHEAMVNHVANLSILMKPLDEVMKHIPKFAELEKNEEAFERMKKLSGKVCEMRKQREMLESQLRDSILNDDITKSLVVKKGEDLDTVFHDELQKHDKITQLLDQNLLAQENIIRALTEANAEYAETRSATVELKRKRDTVIQSMIGSYEAYDELISKCNIGIEFYTKLNTNVEKLLQRVKSVCKVQNEEREINMERIIRKAQNHQNPQGMPGVPTSIAGVGTYTNPMISGGYPGYPQAGGTTVNTAIPPPSAFANAAGNSLPPTSRLPSSGGHLKLKDYLAMKKEGQTAASLASNMMKADMNDMRGPSHAMPQPQVAPYDVNAAQSQFHQQQPVVSSPSPHPATPPVAPAPNMPTYDPSMAQHQNNMQMPASVSASMPPAPVSHVPTYDPSMSVGLQYHNNPMTHPPPTPPVSYTPTYNPKPVAVGQPQHLHNPMMSSAPSVVPQSQPQIAGYNSNSIGNQQHPVQPQPQQHQMVPQNPVPTSVNTNSATSVPQTPYSGTNGFSNHRDPSIGGYAAYQQQQPSVQSHQPSIPPQQMPQPQQQAGYNNYNYKSSPYYNSPAATPPPPVQVQSQPTPPPQNSSPAPIPTATVYPQPQQPPVSGYYPGQQQQSYPSNIPNPAGVGQTSQPTNVDDTASYSQSSFLAQYVRQRQGYLSSNNQTPSSSGGAAPTFPNFAGNVASTQMGGYSQQMGYNPGYGQQQQQPPTQNQYPTYGQQQQWQQPNQMPSSSHPQPTSQQSQPYPNTDQQSYSTNQPQQYQQYGVAPQQQQVQPPSNYYNAAPQQQQVNYQQNQQVPYQPGQEQPKPVRNSNLDLLSDIDFNALPAVEPLAPVVLPQTRND